MFMRTFVSSRFKAKVCVNNNNVTCLSIDTFSDVAEEDSQESINIITLGFGGEYRISDDLSALDKQEINAVSHLDYSFNNHIVGGLPLAMPSVSIMAILRAFKFKIDVKLEESHPDSDLDKINAQGLATFNIKDVEYMDSAFLNSVENIKDAIDRMEEEDLEKVLPLLQSIEDNIDDLTLADFIRDTQPVTFSLGGNLAATIGVSHDASTFVSIVNIKGTPESPDFHVDAINISVDDKGEFKDMCSDTGEPKVDEGIIENNPVCLYVREHVNAFSKFKLFVEDSSSGDNSVFVPYAIPVSAIESLLRLARLDLNALPKALVDAIGKEFNSNITIAEKVDESNRIMSKDLNK